MREVDIAQYWERLAYDKRDLSNCESEPLQFCGAIQPEGVLLACLADPASGHEIVAASANCHELLGVAAEQALGVPLAELLQGGEENGRDRGPRPVRAVRHGGLPLAATFQCRGDHLLVDLEPLEEEWKSGRSVVELQDLIDHVDQAADLQAIGDTAVRYLRQLTGLDRVMLYRFDGNWDGLVLAEAHRDDLESFLGLMYPASDIPAQARKLYLDCRYRMICDTESMAVPMLTRPGLGRSELDLGISNLRASSPIHLQYLHNMGVRSSFCVPVKHNGELWGLISCHHYSEGKVLPMAMRSACVLAGQVLTGRIAHLVNERRLVIKNSILQLSQSLLARVTQGQSAVTAFSSLGDAMLNLTGSSGAYVRLADEECFIGECPGREFIDQLWTLLRRQHSMALWSSRSLQSEHGLPADPRAVGALAVPFSLEFGDLLVWFRPEHRHEIRWGGQPTVKAATPAGLEPRASFASWSEQVSGRSRDWTEPDREAAQFLLFNFVQGIFIKAADLSRANSELQALTRAKDEFIGMISHELRTPLGVIIGWIDILRDFERGQPGLAEPLDVIERNAKLQVTLINDLLDISRISSGKMRLNLQSGVDSCALVHDVIASLQPTAQARRIELTCHPCDLIPLTADPDRLRQVVWNLVTNALKFTPKGGRVDVYVQRHESSCEISVKDSGVGLEPGALSRVFERFIQVDDTGQRSGGLGLGLSIVKSLVELHGGKVRASSEGLGRGATFTAQLPIFTLREEAPQPAEPKLDRSLPSALLNGVRVLLAEDQEEAAHALAYLLRRHGGEVTVVHSGNEALARLRASPFDLLLSDIGMPDGDGYELIRRWRALEKERQTPPLPAVALTAYASSADRARALESGFQSHIPKPVDKQELLAVLKGLKLKGE